MTLRIRAVTGRYCEGCTSQIEEKAYDAELTARGITSENIGRYGFAFEGKKVLIG